MAACLEWLQNRISKDEILLDNLLFLDLSRDRDNVFVSFQWVDPEEPNLSIVYAVFQPFTKIWWNHHLPCVNPCKIWKLPHLFLLVCSSSAWRFWDAKTNLIRFYWNLHHILNLVWIIWQFFVHHNITRSSGWIPRSNNGSALQVENNILGCQAAVSLMLLSKNLLFSTLGSQITKDFVWIKLKIHLILSIYFIS